MLTYLESPRAKRGFVSGARGFTRRAFQKENSVEGCGGLKGETPGAFPKAWPIFQQPFSLPENAQTLAGIASRAAGKSVKNFQKFAGKLFQQGISDSHSLLEFYEYSTIFDTPHFLHNLTETINVKKFAQKCQDLCTTP